MAYKDLDKRREAGRRDYYKHRARRLVAKAEYYQKNRSKLVEEKRQYRVGREGLAILATKKWYAMHKEEALEKAHERRLRASYGITKEEYDARMASQAGLCKICGKPQPDLRKTKRLCVDHSHTTGKVRALLCRNCNAGLGMFKDDPVLLEHAASYLREHSRVGDGTGAEGQTD